MTNTKEKQIKSKAQEARSRAADFFLAKNYKQVEMCLKCARKWESKLARKVFA